mgnify:CR=1 FL=1
MRAGGRIAGALAALALAAGAARAEIGDDLVFFSLGSGELDGGYHQTARAICAAVNDLHRGAIRCSPETTPGSRYNLDALFERELDFAILQADVAAGAARGGALRLVSGLYDETITLLAAPGSAIRSQADLRGRRLDIGPPASGRNVTVRGLVSRLGLGMQDFEAVLEHPGPATVAALCAGDVDAAILVVGHPSALVAESLACGARIAEVAGPEIDALVAEAPYLRRARIPAWRYDVFDGASTVALRAALVTRADTPDGVVRAVVGAMIARREALAAAIPLLRGLEPAAMAEPGAGLALHPGAAAAFAAD